MLMIANPFKGGWMFLYVHFMFTYFADISDIDSFINLNEILHIGRKFNRTLFQFQK